MWNPVSPPKHWKIIRHKCFRSGFKEDICCRNRMFLFFYLFFPQKFWNIATFGLDVNRIFALLVVTIVEDHAKAIVMIHWFIRLVSKKLHAITSETGCVRLPVITPDICIKTNFRSMPIIGLCSCLDKSQPYENLFLSLDFVFWHKLLEVLQRCVGGNQHQWWNLDHWNQY